ncbi:zinc finger, CCHC-type containing protein [Tanacetum coccineum]
MASNFAKLDKFEEVDFRRWHKKMHFLLMAEEDALLALQHECGAKYMADDASSKKFLVSNFTNYKMTDSRPVMEQYNELLDFKHTLKHLKEELTLVELGSHLRIEESLKVQDSDKPKGNNVAGPSFVNMVEHNNSFAYNDNKGKRKHHDNTRADPNKKAKPTCWKCGKTGHIKRDCKGVNVGNKANGSSTKGSVNGSSNSLKCQNMFNKSLQVYYVTYVSEANFVHDDDFACWVDSGATVHVCKDRCIECIFVGYAEHSKAFRFYVIEPNDSVSINSIIESRDAIFDESRFLSIPRPSPRIPNGTEDIVGSVVPEQVTKEVVQQPEPELRKSKRNKTLKKFRHGFQLYLIEGTRDEISDQHSYCFNVEDDPKIFDEAMKSQDTYAPMARISTIRLLIDMASIHNLIIHQMDVKTAFLNGDLDEKSYYIEKVLKKFNYFDCTPLSTLMDTSEKLMPNNGQAVSQLEYSRVIGYLMYAMNYTRPDISFAVGKLISLAYTGYPSVLEGYTDASWISNTKDNSSTSGWVFLLGGGEISWATKKQTYITGSTMESEFVALAAAVKEAEWLRNLILEIPLWSKPIAPISIRCYSAATLAKAYSQMYNGKSRHLGVRHSMIRGLITNGLISIEFVRSQQNLATHLMKGLAGDLVIKSAEGMGLKSN